LGGRASPSTRRMACLHLRCGTGVAGALAAFTDWRRSDDKFSQAEIRETRQIIQDYRGILEIARARAGDRALGGATMQPADLFGRRP
jgi:hypothetical protein